MPPVLTDGALTLRRPSLADAEEHLAAEDDEMRLRFDSRGPATLEGMRGAFQRWIDLWDAGGPNFTYLVRLAASHVLVAGCEIRFETAERAGVSYWTYAPFRRQGYAAQAMRLMIEAAARTPGLGTLEARVAPDNLASRALARSLGFVEIGEVEDTAWDGVVSTLIAHQRRADHPAASRPAN
ncbi:MAG: GNAT family N-acetyltransferase [Caulobacteraceae bacterium]